MNCKHERMFGDSKSGNSCVECGWSADVERFQVWRDGCAVFVGRLPVAVAVEKSEEGAQTYLEAMQLALDEYAQAYSAARISQLEAALRRTLLNFERVLGGKPVRDASETIAEAYKALPPAVISCSDATAVEAARKPRDSVNTRNQGRYEPR